MKERLFGREGDPVKWTNVFPICVPFGFLRHQDVKNLFEVLRDKYSLPRQKSPLPQKRMKLGGRAGVKNGLNTRLNNTFWSRF